MKQISIMRILLAVFFASLLPFGISAGVGNLLPTPKCITMPDKASPVVFRSATVSAAECTDAYRQWLDKAGISKGNGIKITGEITGSITGAPEGNDEAYSLTVAPGSVSVKALTPQGLLWGLQTLRQLAETDNAGGISLPEVTIVDWPSFRWRGLLMDTGRSYIGMDELKREIDALADFKMNVFHFHFTENQAWRLESKVFPQLNDSANMLRQPGLFYTHKDLRELADYATARGVLFVPEVDMPGHSQAFEKTFGVSMQTPEGKQIIKKLVDEVCEILPDVPYIHIGTDEVQFTDPTFVPEMVAYVRSKGKKAITWHPGWNYNPGEIDMAQMWSYRGKQTPGIPAIDSRFHYLNHFDTYADIVALYRSNIYGKKTGDEGLAGVEIAVWNDRYVDSDRDNVAQNNLYPTLLATAERSWCGGGEEYFDILGTNLNESDSADFAQFADFERRLLHHKATTLADCPIAYVAQTPVKWRITDAFPNEGNLSAVFPPESEGMKESYTYSDSTFNTGTINGAGIYLRHVWGTLIPGFYKDPKPNHTAYAFTRVYSPVDQTVGLQAETQNYSRSEPDVTPPEGKWDFRESRITVNGEDINPPVWTNRHSERSNEISLGNENLAVRQPIPVKLHKGWNDVMIKLPIGKFSTPETRLAKWMFTFVFTTPDGREAAPGLIYSADIP